MEQGKELDTKRFFKKKETEIRSGKIFEVTLESGCDQRQL